MVFEFNNLKEKGKKSDCDHLEIYRMMFFSQSVIMVVFRDDKSVEDEQKAWEFWHSRQHSHKQRVIDIGKCRLLLKAAIQ